MPNTTVLPSGIEEALVFLRDIETRRLLAKKENEMDRSFILTLGEWFCIKYLVVKHELPCKLVSGCYGFWLEIFEHNERVVIEPKRILLIQDFSFPFPSAKKGFDGQEKTLKILRSLVYRERNIELLVFYGFEELKDDITEYAC